ncbi:MAG: hypothetical protein U9R43_13245 [Thermodesulfobacteriota bacterium]|nr:hypothetical protein [Thermodesulfobacteriota bacterium]
MAIRIPNEVALLTMPGKERLKVQAGSLLCFWAVHELGMNMLILKDICTRCGNPVARVMENE